MSRLGGGNDCGLQGSSADLSTRNNSTSNSSGALPTRASSTEGRIIATQRRSSEATHERTPRTAGSTDLVVPPSSEDLAASFRNSSGERYTFGANNYTSPWFPPGTARRDTSRDGLLPLPQRQGRGNFRRPLSREEAQRWHRSARVNTAGLGGAIRLHRVHQEQPRHFHVPNLANNFNVNRAYTLYHPYPRSQPDTTACPFHVPFPPKVGWRPIRPPISSIQSSSQPGLLRVRTNGPPPPPELPRFL